jgi:hypothetical protein
MHINKIELTKSRTAGLSNGYRAKYNKVTLTMAAELDENDDHKVCYQALNESVDEALDSQFKPKE